MKRHPLFVDGWAEEDLRGLSKEGLLRKLEARSSPQGPIVEVNGEALVNFSSNDYLGLASDSRLIEACRQALGHWGTGTGASRLLVGDTDAHRALETRLAAFERTESARVFNSGYVANVGALSALLGDADAVFSDALNHASIVDGCRLSRAKVVVYPHADVTALGERLRTSSARRKLVCTDTVFSMDGDTAPLVDLVEVCRKHDAVLYVDEAHATGVFGERGAGLCEALGVEGKVDVRMGTLGKALGTFGAYIAGSRLLTELLANRARPFVFSTSLPSALCAASQAAVDVVESGSGLRARLWANIRRFADGLRAMGFSAKPQSAIFSLVLKEPQAALDASRQLRKRGVWVKAIRPPTVPKETSRLRITLSAAHTDEHVDHLLDALRHLEVPVAA